MVRKIKHIKIMVRNVKSMVRKFMNKFIKSLWYEMTIIRLDDLIDKTTLALFSFCDRRYIAEFTTSGVVRLITLFLEEK